MGTSVISSRPKLFYTIIERFGVTHRFYRCARQVYFEAIPMPPASDDARILIPIGVLDERAANPWLIANSYYTRELTQYSDLVAARDKIKVPIRVYQKPKVQIWSQ